MDNTTSNGMRDYMPSEEAMDTSTETVEISQADTGVEEEPTIQAETQIEEPTFTTKFDPKTLSPELQKAYKLMQSDYTAKTQELANARKFHESYGQYEQLLGYIAKNPQLMEAYMNGGLSPQEEEAVEEALEYSDNPIEFAKQIEERATSRAMEMLQSMMSEQQEQAMYEQALQQDIMEAESIDPRLANDDEFSDLVASKVLTDEGVQNGTKSYTQATREAIAWVDSFLSKKLESDKQKLTELARSKRSPVGASSPANTITPDAKPKTMREAAAEFLK